MFHDAFVKLDETEAESVLGEINPALTGGDFNPRAAVVMTQDLSFYPGYRFLDIADYANTPPFRKFVIYKPDDIIVLDGTNGPVYALNDRTTFGLVSSTVADYVRFFFTHVRGPHGRFLLCETVDDIAWHEEPPPAARKAVSDLLTPLAVTDEPVDGSYVLSGCMVFRDALYKADIAVTAAGRVSVSNEELLLDDLPVIDDVLGV